LTGNSGDKLILGRWMKTLLLLVTLILSVMSPFSRADTLVLTLGEYPPLDSKNLPHLGLVPRIVSEAFGLEGITVEYKFLPWARAYADSKEGNVNGTLQWLHSEERAKDHYYSDAIMEESNVWFHLQDTAFSWDTFKDLKGKLIGARIGFTYSPEFYQALEDGLFKAIFLETNLQNLKMLYSRRVDVFIENLDVGYYGAHQFSDDNKIELITHHAKPIFVNTSHLLLSKKHLKSRYYLQKFNQGLQRLKASGRYQQFIDESRQLDAANDDAASES